MNNEFDYDDKFNGYGTHYNNTQNITKQGTFKDGKLIQGTVTEKWSDRVIKILEGNFYYNDVYFEGTKTKYYTELDDKFEIIVNNFPYNKKIYIGTFDENENLHGDNCQIKNRHGIVLYSGSFYHGLWFDGTNKYYETESDNIIFESISEKHGKWYKYNSEHKLISYAEGDFTDVQLSTDIIYSGKFTYIVEKTYGFDNSEKLVEYIDCEFQNGNLLNGKKILTQEYCDKKEKFVFIFENGISKQIEYDNFKRYYIFKND